MDGNRAVILRNGKSNWVKRCRNERSKIRQDKRQCSESGTWELMIFDGTAMSHEDNSRVWIGSSSLEMRRWRRERQSGRGREPRRTWTSPEYRWREKNSKPALMLRESVSVQERRWILDDVWFYHIKAGRILDDRSSMDLDDIWFYLLGWMIAF